MGKDYYAILGVSRDSNPDDIKRAYRKLALKYHPDKNKSKMAEEKFKEISEAYEVLSNPSKRDLFNTYGEEGLKEQAGNTNFHFDGSSGDPSFRTYTTFSSGDARETFSRVFGDEDPFQNFFGNTRVFGDPFNFQGSGIKDFGFPNFGNGAKFNFGGTNFHNHVHGERGSVPMETDFFGMHCQKKARLQDQSIERDLFLSLEELNTGCVKKIKITKQVLNHDGVTAQPAEKILAVNIKRGWKEGTRITFSNEGDQKPGRIAADIIFTIRDKKHPYFTRDAENNLLYKAKMSLRDALCGGVLEVPTLDGSRLNVCLNDVITPETTKRIPGKGLPLPKCPDHCSDLLIKFDISFPDSLSGSVKDILRSSLPR